MKSCSECQYWQAFPNYYNLPEDDNGMCNEFAVYSSGSSSCSKFTPNCSSSQNEVSIDPLKSVNEKRDAILREIFGE